MPTDGCTESMIVGIQCFRENRILDGNVYCRKFQPVSVCPSVVYMTVDRHVFIQSPTGGAMVNHDISNRIPSYCIITESYVLRTAAEAHVANHNIVCIDQERLSGDADTISGSRLSGNGYIRGTYANRAFQTNHSRYIEYNNTCTSRFAGFAQCSGAGIFQRSDHDHFTSTTTGSIHTSAFRAGESRDITFYQIFGFGGPRLIGTTFLCFF